MPISMKDLALHVASIAHPQEAGEALASGIAEAIATIRSKNDVANTAEDIRRNATALAAAILWNTNAQGTMAPPAPVPPPWLDDHETAPQEAEPAAATGEQLEVDPAVDEASAADDRGHETQEAAEDDSEVGEEYDGEEMHEDTGEDDNGPVDEPARVKRPKKKKRR